MKFWLSDSSNGVTTTLYSGIIKNCIPSYQVSSLVALWADSSPLGMKLDTRGCNSCCFPRRLVVIHTVSKIRVFRKAFSTEKPLYPPEFSVLTTHNMTLIFQKFPSLRSGLLVYITRVTCSLLFNFRCTCVKSAASRHYWEKFPLEHWIS